MTASFGFAVIGFALIMSTQAAVMQNGKWLTQIPTRGVLESQGFAAYIGGSHTCDNLRAKNHYTHWVDSENKKWLVTWGSNVNLCFRAGPDIWFHSGHVQERMGMDRQITFACCQFLQQKGGWGRDDYTRVCCSAYAKGSGLKSTDPDYFSKMIDLMNAGAPYAEAAASAMGGSGGKKKGK